MGLRLAFVDDMQAAKDFASGDVVRKMGIQELVTAPYVGYVVYSNPRTGKVHVQWPWGAEEEAATSLIRDITGDVPPNSSLNQSYSTWEMARHINDPATLKADAKWRKGLASRVADKFVAADRILKIISAHERKTIPIWQAACHAYHHGIGEIETFRLLAAEFGEEYGLEAVRLTVANLWEAGRNPSSREALYWKDGNRRYKVTKREKDSKKLTCPRCKGTMRPRTYRHGKRVLQCPKCGFSIAPKDLIWDAEQPDAGQPDNGQPDAGQPDLKVHLV